MLIIYLSPYWQSYFCHVDERDPHLPSSGQNGMGKAVPKGDKSLHGIVMDVVLE